jgi:hypothetical protein
VLQQKAFAPWALATSNNCGIVIQPQGANLDLTSDDATARQKYKLTLGPNGDARCRMLNGLVTVPSRPIAPTDTQPSMENVFYTNDNPTSNNWSAIASSQTSERFYDYQVDNPPFTSQTVIASSYGLHQVLYQTAVGMGYVDQNRLGLSPGNLFDPATSLDLGTEYLAQMFVLSGGLNNPTMSIGRTSNINLHLRYEHSTLARARRKVLVFQRQRTIALVHHQTASLCTPVRF